MYYRRYSITFDILKEDPCLKKGVIEPVSCFIASFFDSKPKDTYLNACSIQVVGYLVVELFVPSRIEVA